MEDLRNGTAILREFIEIETEKAERAARSKIDQKVVNEAIANQVSIIEYILVLPQLMTNITG